MEPGGSLPQSQETVTCPCPEPAQSSPCPPSHFFRSILILSSHLPLGLTSCLLPSGLPTKILYAQVCHPACYMPRPSHSWTLNIDIYFAELRLHSVTSVASPCPPCLKWVKNITPSEGIRYVHAPLPSFVSCPPSSLIYPILAPLRHHMKPLYQIYRSFSDKN
jgi:hypothetical protein